MSTFFDEILKTYDNLKQRLKTYFPIDLSNVQNNSTYCHICEEPFAEGDVIVKDKMKKSRSYDSFLLSTYTSRL